MDHFMLTKEALQEQLSCGQHSAIELLYATYGGMIYGYIRQFVLNEQDAQDLLITFFSDVASRLQEACDSKHSIYSWLQIEARKTILNTRGNQVDRIDRIDQDSPDQETPLGSRQQGIASLLQDASPEHREVFGKVFLQGMPIEDVAFLMGKDPAYIEQLFRESLLIIRNRLG